MKLQNIKINYLYRDASNYKQFGSIVFTNNSGLGLNHVEKILRGRLIDGEYFSALQWGFPELFFHTSTADDHEWHEWWGIEFTDEKSNLDIEGLIGL